MYGNISTCSKSQGCTHTHLDMLQLSCRAALEGAPAEYAQQDCEGEIQQEAHSSTSKNESETPGSNHMTDRQP